MYLLYMDESGDPRGWSDQNHFVIAGVAVHEGQVHHLTRKMDEIQEAYFPEIQVPLAFHAGSIKTGKERFRNLSPESRVRLLDALCDIFVETRFPSLIAFATVMHISVVSPDRSQVLPTVFEDICQRFNTFLVRQFNAGHKDKGLLVIDQAHEAEYRDLLAGFQTVGTIHGYIGNVVDIPYFAGRRDTRMLQLADLCAYAVFRRYEHGDSAYFEKVLPRLDRRGRGGPLDGLKHLTNNRGCSCEACARR